MTRNDSTLFILTVALVLTFPSSSRALSSVRDKQGVSDSSSDTLYLYSFFRDPDGTGGLCLAYSNDLLNWTEIEGPFFEPEFGEHIRKKPENKKLIRDPFLVRDPDPDGGYHMTWTTGWGRKDIGCAHTKDLINWTDAKPIPVMEDWPAENCWAPKLFFSEQDKNWIIAWSSTLSDDTFPKPKVPGTSRNHRIWYVTTRDFKTFSKAKVYFDPGYSVIDACLLKDDGKYYLFFKDERANDTDDYNPEYQNIRTVESSSIYGPFTNISAPITGNGPGRWLNEGPTPMKVGDTYYCFYDHHGPDKYYGLVRSKDLKNWEDVSYLTALPEKSKHGNMFKVPASELKELLNSRKEIRLKNSK